MTQLRTNLIAYINNLLTKRMFFLFKMIYFRPPLDIRGWKPNPISFRSPNPKIMEKKSKPNPPDPNSAELRPETAPLPSLSLHGLICCLQSRSWDLWPLTTVDILEIVGASADSTPQVSTIYLENFQTRSNFDKICTLGRLTKENSHFWLWLCLSRLCRA